MPPKGVLIVSYAYPPIASPGALRMSKFAKYLPKFGWTPIVLTSAGGYSAAGTGLIPDADSAVIVGIRDPGAGTKRIAAPDRGTPKGRRSMRSRLVSLAQLMLVPDRDISWLPVAVVAGLGAVRRYDVDAITSTSPSITNHLVAYIIARRKRLWWVADFRDAWTFAPTYTAPRWRRCIDEWIERRIVHRADRITVVSEFIKNQFIERFPQHREKMNVIRNGFDPTDFVDLPAGRPADNRYELLYAGTFYGAGRNPGGLFGAIRRLHGEGLLTASNFAFTIVGAPEREVVSLAESYGVQDVLHFAGRKSYHEAVRHMKAASSLLVLTHTDPGSRGEMTTKFFDYLGAGRPILLLTPGEFEIATAARSAGVSAVFDPGDEDAIAEWLRGEILHHGREGRRPDRTVAAADSFTREAGTAQLAGLLAEALVRP